jgi:hypothetical protein
VPVLLHFALAASVNGTEFPGAVLVGRVRPGGGREVIVTAAPFSASSREQVRAFLDHVDNAFLPTPQGGASSISMGVRHPALSIPEVFDGCRRVLDKLGWNPASLHGDGIASGTDLYDAAVWSAIRSGWREGYNLEAEHIGVRSGTPEEVAESMEAARNAIRTAAGYTKFTIDTSPHLDLRADHRSAQGWSEPDVLRIYEETLDGELRRWIEAELVGEWDIAGVKYVLPFHEVRRLAVKFTRSLLLAENLYDTAVEMKRSRAFDFEISLDESETLTTGKELIFCLHWLSHRGRALQSIAPNLGFKKLLPYPETMDQLVDYTRPKLWIDLAPRVALQFNGNPIWELAARAGELAQVARSFNATISVRSGDGKQALVLQTIGRATAGRVIYKVPEIHSGHADYLMYLADNLRS